MKAVLLIIGIIILAVGALIAISNFGLLPFNLPLPADITIAGMTLPIIAIGGLIAVIGIILVIAGIKMY